MDHIEPFNIQQDPEFNAESASQVDSYTESENRLIDAAIELARGLHQGALFVSCDGSVIPLSGSHSEIVGAAVGILKNRKGPLSQSAVFVTHLLLAHSRGALTPDDAKWHLENFADQYTSDIETVEQFAKDYPEQFAAIASDANASREVNA